MGLASYDPTLKYALFKNFKRLFWGFSADSIYLPLTNSSLDSAWLVLPVVAISWTLSAVEGFLKICVALIFRKAGQ